MKLTFTDYTMESGLVTSRRAFVKNGDETLLDYDARHFTSGTVSHYSAFCGTNMLGSCVASFAEAQAACQSHFDALTSVIMEHESRTAMEAP